MSVAKCFDHHKEQAEEHASRGEWRFAIHELKQCIRLRPRDDGAKLKLREAKALAREADPKQRFKPMLRFVCHFNMSIRYWDLGKPRLAHSEAELAYGILQKLRLPFGCASHNLEAMSRLQEQFRDDERRLARALDATRGRGIRQSYQLGVLYFDKRMLLRAEAQLKWTHEQLKSRCALKLVQHEKEQQQKQGQKGFGSSMGGGGGSNEDDNPTLRWMQEEEVRKDFVDLRQDLEAVEDDLEFLAQTKETFCVEAEEGKSKALVATGVRDGLRPQLLPCLQARLSTNCSACNEWWADLCSRPDLDFQL